MSGPARPSTARSLARTPAAHSTRLRRRHRRGEGGIGAVAGLGLIVVVVIGYIAMAFVPVWFDYLAVQEICRTVVIDWLQHDKESQAIARFNSEHKRKRLSEDIDASSCEFIDNPGAYEVICEWTQYAYYPGTNYYKGFPLTVHVRYENGKARLIKD